MFYPVESLRRGGRFYFCWVADSWPLRFATITHRQLWSQDIRQICDDLLQVMNRESGYASARFSLRLSSQLMRGVVRLYQRKVNTFLGDLCMINATVIKHSNKKWGHESSPRKREIQPRIARPRVEEIPENEERVEERILSSGNVVANIEEITLKETAIPEVQIPTDGFGEENQDQPLQLLLNDRTVEEMLGHTNVSLAQHSDLLALDGTGLEKSHDKSRLPPLEGLQMERLSDNDITFRKSTVVADLQIEDIEKDVLQIPDCPIPELPVPPPPEKELNPEETTVQPESSKEKGPLPELELEELEDIRTEPKRKRPRKLIIDKKTKISGNILRQRLENVAVELRCEDSSDDIIDVRRLPSDIYMQRPAGAGARLQSAISYKLTRLFKRNLGFIERVDDEMEYMLADGGRRHIGRGTLPKIIEDEASMVQQVPQIVIEPVNPDPVIPEDYVVGNLTENRFSVTVEPLDIADLPTQVLKTASQESLAQKRSKDIQDVENVSPKKIRHSGYTSYKLSQKLAEEEFLLEEKQKKDKQREVSRKSRSTGKGVDKPTEESFNLPQLPQDIVMEEQQDILQIPETDKEKRISQMLEEVGLADAHNILVAEAKNMSQKTYIKNRTEEGSSETPLGSLDRTKVDLGDSEKTTDTQRFLRKEWGTQGTMLKVVRLLNHGVHPLDVKALVEKGPVLSSKERIVAARCFTALLKLKQHNFVKLEKDSATLEILDISCGSKFPKKVY